MTNERWEWDKLCQRIGHVLDWTWFDHRTGLPRKIEISAKLVALAPEAKEVQVRTENQGELVRLQWRRGEWHRVHEPTRPAS